MKTIDPQQIPFTKQAHLAPVVMVTLTTYSDHDAATVYNTHRWSHPYPVRYWYGTYVEYYFRDVIAGITVPTQSIPRTPNARGFSSRLTCALSLVNESINGTRLWTTLKAENLHGATVEVAELLVHPTRLAVDGSTAWWDFRDLNGTEHTILFRGELEAAEQASEELIELRFSTIQPTVPKVELLDASTNDPRDFGSQLPIVYGAMKRVPCKNIQIGWRTTLAESIDEAMTGVKKVTDATGLPTASTFDLLIGTELIRCSASDHTNHTVTITTRGYASSPPVQHIAGEVALEMLSDGIIVGCAGHKISGIDAIYLANPFNQELMRLPVSEEQRLEDPVTIPGETIASFALSSGDMMELAEQAFRSARMVAQPSYGGTTGTDSAMPEGGTEAVSSDGHNGNWSDDTGLGAPDWPRWTATASGTPHTLTRSFDGMVLDNVDTVYRWRVVIEVTVYIGNPDVYSRKQGVKCRIYNVEGFSAGHTVAARRWGPGVVQAISNWKYPDPALGVTMETLDTDNAYFVFEGYGDAIRYYPTDDTGTQFEITAFYIEAETETGIGSITSPGEIEAASIGYGLQFYADVRGYSVPYDFSTCYGFETHVHFDSLGCTPSTDISEKVQGGASVKIIASAATAIIQMDNVGGLDMTTHQEVYRFSWHCVNASSITSMRIWFDNAVTAGTSIPATRREINIPNWAFVEDQWITLELNAVDIGAPTVNAVQTIGCEIISTGAYPTVHIDNLESAAATNADYSGDPGDLIENGPDQKRHFIAEHCGLGHGVIDDTTFDAAITNLGSNVYAGIVNGLGATFDEIMSAWDFETRSHLIATEASTGTIYKLITANTSGSYGSSGGTLGDLVDIREARKDFREIATRFRALWAWDPFLGTGEDAFTQVTRADADVNDVSALLATVNFTNAETRMGRRDADPFFLLMVRDEATAEDIVAFYARVFLNDAASDFVLESPTWDCYALEPGDIRELTPSWDGSATKCKVLSVERAPTEPMGRLRLTEVD